MILGGLLPAGGQVLNRLAYRCANVEAKGVLHVQFDQHRLDVAFHGGVDSFLCQDNHHADVIKGLAGLQPLWVLALEAVVQLCVEPFCLVLARGNADIILLNLCFVHGGTADEDRYGYFSD